jgi:hypothetical protein
VDSIEHLAFERRLNLAFAAAWQGSGQAIVLERWRLRDLVFENKKIC